MAIIKVNSQHISLSGSKETMNQKYQGGFTLLEILVSIGVIAVIGTLITQIFFSITRSNVKGEILKEVKQSGEFALQIMERVIRNARNITSTCTPIGYASGSISLTNPDGSSTTLSSGLDGTVMRISSTTGVTTQYLTSNTITLGAVSTLQFICTSTADTPSSVKISFSLAQKGTPVDQFEKASAQFQTTVNLRNK